MLRFPQVRASRAAFCNAPNKSEKRLGGLRKTLRSGVEDVTDHRKIDSNHMEDFELPRPHVLLYIVTIKDSDCLATSDDGLKGIWPFTAHKHVEFDTGCSDTT